MLHARGLLTPDNRITVAGLPAVRRSPARRVPPGPRTNPPLHRGRSWQRVEPVARRSRRRALRRIDPCTGRRGRRSGREVHSTPTGLDLGRTVRGSASPTPRRVAGGRGQRGVAPLLQRGGRPHPGRDLSGPDGDQQSRTLSRFGRSHSTAADHPVRSQSTDRPSVLRSWYRPGTRRGYPPDLFRDAAPGAHRSDLQPDGGRRSAAAHRSRCGAWRGAPAPAGRSAPRPRRTASRRPSPRHRTTGELLGVARPTAGRHLAALRDNGLVTWDGDSPKDSRATWRLTRARAATLLQHIAGRC